MFGQCTGNWSVCEGLWVVFPALHYRILCCCQALWGEEQGGCHRGGHVVQRPRLRRWRVQSDRVTCPRICGCRAVWRLSQGTTRSHTRPHTRSHCPIPAISISLVICWYKLLLKNGTVSWVQITVTNMIHCQCINNFWCKESPALKCVTGLWDLLKKQGTSLGYFHGNKSYITGPD